MGVFSIIIFLSQLVFAYLIATVTACLTNADAARARFSFKLTSAKLYMAREGVDQSLRNRVIKYYNYLWQRTKGVEPQQLFLSLPRSIWGSVSYCLYGDLVRLLTHSSIKCYKKLSSRRETARHLRISVGWLTDRALH